MKELLEGLLPITIEPKFLMAVAHKDANVRSIWWYNVATGEMRSSSNPKDIHSSDVFKDVAHTAGWIRGRVFEFEGKAFLIIYTDRLTASQLLDIISKAEMFTKLTIDHAVDYDGKDMSHILEGALR